MNQYKAIYINSAVYVSDARVIFIYFVFFFIFFIYLFIYLFIFCKVQELRNPTKRTTLLQYMISKQQRMACSREIYGTGVRLEF